MQPTPEQLKQADLIYQHVYFWVLLNARESGWFDVKLPDSAIEKLVAGAAKAALTTVSADVRQGTPHKAPGA